GQQITANQINLASQVTGTLPVANGGTGLTGYGSTNQILGMNAAGTALEYKTFSGTTDQITLTNAANSLTFSLPQDIATTSTPTFGGLTLNGNQTLNGTLAIQETGTAPSFYTTFQGGDQTGNITYTLPTGAPAANSYVLSSATDGTLSWQPVSGVGGMTSFSLAADTGTTQTINNGETITIQGGTNIGSTIDGSNNVVLNLDSTLTGVTWNGNDIDISDYTNLTGDTEIVLTGDSLSIAQSIARDTELHSPVTLAGQNYLTLTGQQITANQINLASQVTGTLPVGNGGTGLTGYGSTNQILGMNAAGTALEYKTFSGTTDQITLTNAANSLTFSLPQDIATTSTPTFGGLTLNGNQTLNGTL
ncbi:hypothetical protein EG867_15960, partial [Enterococcus faecalis]